MSITCLLIKPSNINHLTYNDSKYVDNILEYVEEVKVDPDDFVNSISYHLHFNDASNQKIDIHNNIFEEEPNYIYEIMFKSSENNNDEINENLNEIGMIINNENIQITGNIIIFKEFIPSLTNEVSFNDMLKDDLKRILLHRRYNSVVTWNDKWNEYKINDLHEYINIFFDGEEPEIKHIEFLMHNIHIFYIEYKHGNKYICGRLLNDIPIEKCLIITMKSEEYVGNITLDEVKKIIQISEKMDKYIVPQDFLEDDIAKNGRSIKNTKYKILDKVYNKYY